MAPAGLLTDFDGTLSPIVADPASARPVAGSLEALQVLSRRLAMVGVISGRAADDVRRLLGPAEEHVLVIGNHGLEWQGAGAVPVRNLALDAAREAVATAVAALAFSDGVAIEDKGLSATVHYRNASDPAAARRQVLDAMGPARDGIEIREGRMSIELRPAGLGDKGTAVRQLVEQYGLRGLVVAGDDVTDLDMFRAARELADSGDLRIAVLAVAGGPEVPPGVAAAADVVLPSPVEFVRALQELAARLRAVD